MATGSAVSSRDERLEIDERFEPALRDLRLIGRIRGVPRRVFEHVAQDDGGRVTAVIAHADHRAHDAIAARDFAQLAQDPGLAARLRKVERRRTPDVCRHHRSDECVQRCVTELRQHVGHVVFARTDVAGRERTGVGVEFEIGRTHLRRLRCHDVFLK